MNNCYSIRTLTLFTAIVLFCCSLFVIEAEGQVLLSGRPLHIPSATQKTRLHSIMRLDNPALGGGRGAVLSVVPSRFGMSELTSGQLLLAEEFNDEVSASLSITGLGNSLYNEFSATGYTAYAISEDFSLGGGLQYTRLAIEEAGALGNVQLHVGALAHVSENVSIGFAVDNVNRAYFEGGETTVDQRALISMGITALPEMNIDVGALVLLNGGSALTVALSYDLFDNVRLRTAAQSFPQTGEFGFAFDFDNLQVAAMAQYHMNLGFSQSAIISYRW